MALSLGEEFTSFTDFDERLEEHSEATFSQFYFKSSKTVEFCNKARPEERQISNELKYGILEIYCVLGGERQNSRGSAKFQKGPVWASCPAFIKLQASRDGTKLRVTAMKVKHNHEVSEEIYRQLPERGLLVQKEARTVLNIPPVVYEPEPEIDKETVPSPKPGGRKRKEMADSAGTKAAETGKKKKKQRRCGYSQDSVNEALRRMELGEMSARMAERKYGVPSSTLLDKLHGKTPVNPRHGPPTLLTAEEEKLVVSRAVEAFGSGKTFTMEMLLQLAKEVPEELGRFNVFRGEKPSKSWLVGFKERHQEIAQMLNRKKAESTIVNLDHWFKILQIKMEGKDAVSIFESPDRMWTAGEFVFGFNKRTGKVEKILKGRPKCYEDKRISVYESVSASGMFVPPLVCFPGNRIPKGWNPLKGTPDSWMYGFSQSGSPNSDMFCRWVQEQFHPYLLAMGVPFPVLLIMDVQTKVCVTEEAGNFCTQNGIILHRYPPTTADVIKPLRLAIFEPLKEAFNHAESHWLHKHNKEALTRETFARVYAKARVAIQDKPDLAQRGFWAAGLHPYTGNYNRDVLNPTDVTQEANPAESSTSLPPESSTSLPPEVALAVRHLVEEELPARDVVALSSGSIVVVNASDPNQDILEQALSYTDLDNIIAKHGADHMTTVNLLDTEGKRKSSHSISCMVCAPSDNQCRRRKGKFQGQWTRKQLAELKLFEAKQAVHIAQRGVKEAVAYLGVARRDARGADQSEMEAREALKEASKVVRETGNEARRLRNKLKDAELRRREAWNDVSQARQLMRLAEREVRKAEQEDAKETRLKEIKEMRLKEIRLKQNKEMRTDIPVDGTVEVETSAELPEQSGCQGTRPFFHGDKCPRCEQTYENATDERLSIKCMSCPLRFHVSCTDLNLLPAAKVAEVQYLCPWCAYS